MIHFKINQKIKILFNIDLINLTKYSLMIISIFFIQNQKINTDLEGAIENLNLKIKAT